MICSKSARAQCFLVCPTYGCRRPFESETHPDAPSKSAMAIFINICDFQNNDFKIRREKKIECRISAVGAMSASRRSPVRAARSSLCSENYNVTRLMTGLARESRKPVVAAAPAATTEITRETSVFGPNPWTEQGKHVKESTFMRGQET